jgi:hypothetical protein
LAEGGLLFAVFFTLVCLVGSCFADHLTKLDKTRCLALHGSVLIFIVCGGVGCQGKKRLLAILKAPLPDSVKVRLSSDGFWICLTMGAL